jgi:predicted nuclease of predicted toxin-antitoxin system
VKLIFDENLRPKLPKALSSEFPGSVHVRTAGLLGAQDQKIWEYSRAHAFTIVSKDTDSRERSLVEGSPPKVIWLDIGNSGTDAIAELLRQRQALIRQFVLQDTSSFLILSSGDRAL